MPLINPPVPVGTILMWGTTTAPAGYAICNGASVLRAVFAELFAVIGTTFGSVDGTHFTLPDFRQAFPLGVAAAGTGNTLAGTGGAIDHTHTGPSHTHAVPATATTAVARRTDAPTAGTAAQTHTHTASADGTGATGTANPPFLAINFIIKLY